MSGNLFCGAARVWRVAAGFAGERARSTKAVRQGKSFGSIDTALPHAGEAEPYEIPWRDPEALFQPHTNQSGHGC